MSQKGLANLLKAVVIGIGLCGLAVYFYFIPAWAQLMLQGLPKYEICYRAWIIFIAITGLPCYLALICGYRIAAEIGRDNSFSTINARLLKYVTWMAAYDSAFLFIGSCVFYALGMSSSALMLHCCLVVFAGVSVTVVTAALSHLVYKAASLKEETELTI